MADEGKKEDKKDENKGDDDGEETSKERPKGKDLWQIILSQSSSTMTDQQDINILFLGNKKVGKTTLIQRLLKRDEKDLSAPKPTTALEYSHGQRTERNQVKMAHFWELGGGQQLASLLDVLITPDNIHTVLVVLTLDLTEGRSAWNSLHFWMNKLKKRVGDCFVKLKQKGSSTPGKMLSRMSKRFGEKHPDLEGTKVTIIGVPIVILATKFDIFKDEGPEPMKIMGKTLRFWAHSYAAALCLLSIKDEKDMTKYRQLLNHLIFAVPLTSQMEFDHTKTLLVLPGKDSFKEIGPPAQCQRPAGFQTSGNEELDKWKAVFETVFPPVKDKEKKEETYDIQNPEFAEPSVDAMRSVKDDELEQYRQRRRKAYEDQLRREAKAKAGADGDESKTEKKEKEKK